MPADGDEPAAVRFEQRAIDARLVVEPGEVRLGAQVQQVGPAGVVLSQQDQVVPAVGDAGVRAVVAIAGRDVGLDAQDRLDPGLVAREVEGDSPEQVAVVGDGDRVHAQLFHACHQPIDAVAAVQQRVLGVQVQVGEAGGGCVVFIHNMLGVICHKTPDGG